MSKKKKEKNINNNFNNKDKKHIKIFNNKIEIEKPIYKHNLSNGYIKWGKDNLFPEKLLEIYSLEGSNKHTSIINRKNYMKTAGGISSFKSNYITEKQINEVIEKCGLDDEIFEGFCFEIIWSNDGEDIVKIKHIPFANIRIGIVSDDIPFEHFYYSKNWKEYRKSDNTPQIIKKYQEGNKKGKELVYFSRYNPLSNDIYPIPSYYNSLNWILTDFEISNFHLNNASNGYAPSIIISFMNGYPTEEEEDENYKAIENNFSGTSNAGKAMITYGEGEEQRPIIQAFPTNDSDKKFDVLMPQVTENIMIGHQITNPQLFGIRVPGELGGKNNLQEALDIFQSVYISPRQRIFNEILSEVFEQEISIDTYKILDENSIDKKELFEDILKLNEKIKEGLLDWFTAKSILLYTYNIEENEITNLLINEPDNE